MVAPAGMSTRLAALPVRAALALLLAAVRFLPSSALPALASALAVLTRPLTTKDRRRLAQNVHRIWGLPPGSHFAEVFARQVPRMQILCALETLKEIQKPGSLRVEGFEQLQANVRKAEAAAKGHILVTAHLGSWELCANFGAKAARGSFQVLAKPSRSAVVTETLDSLRRRMGTPVLWTDRKSILRDMLTAVRGGNSIGFVMDQKPEARKGPVVRFFDRDTEFVSGPAMLAIKTGCAVLTIFCVRTGPMRYRLLSEELAPALHGESDEVALTQRMATAIEAVVRLYPEQWTWSYKRWRWEESQVTASGGSVTISPN